MNRLLTFPVAGWRLLSSGGSSWSRLIGVGMMVLILYVVLMFTDENARSVRNLETIAGRLGFYGVITLGAGVLIIAGGIDLSIGSVIGLGAVGFSLLLRQHVPPEIAALAVIAGGAAIGLFHGLLVTKLRLQPFLVTLCGLFIYRGMARGLSGENIGLTVTGASPAFQQHIEAFRTWTTVGTPLGVPQEMVVMLTVALVLGLFLHGTRYGRYLYALGANEEAARYAGVPVDAYKILSYVICSTLAGLASVLYILEARTATASSAGSLMELYAITGAVLGGCSLRGGEGSVVGMVLGTAVLPLLRQLVIFGGFGTEIEYAVIGVALLLGTILDELLKRRGMRRA
jgi:ribose transport system permease protein